MTFLILIVQAYFLARTVQKMSETEESQLRAYVLGHDSGVTIVPVNIQAFELVVNVRVKNSGQTPANNAKFWTGCGICDYPHNDFPDNPNQVAETVLAPGGIYITRRNLGVITPAIYKDLIESRKAIYAFGKITYRTFGKDRYTHFRLVCVGSDIDQKTGIGIFQSCSDGNRYD